MSRRRDDGEPRERPAPGARRRDFLKTSAAATVAARAGRNPLGARELARADVEHGASEAAGIDGEKVRLTANRRRGRVGSPSGVAVRSHGPSSAAHRRIVAACRSNTASWPGAAGLTEDRAQGAVVEIAPRGQLGERAGQRVDHPGFVGRAPSASRRVPRATPGTRSLWGARWVCLFRTWRGRGRAAAPSRARS